MKGGAPQLAGGAVRLALPTPAADTAAEPRKRRKVKPAVVVAKTLVLNPWDNGRLRGAVALGAALEVEFDGYGLTITAVLP